MKRIVFLDYVRVFACFLVMIVHSSENFYGAAGSTDMAGPQSYLASEADRLWVAVYDGFSRMAVPLIHDCLRLSPCSDERRTNYMAILSPAIPSYHTTIFYIHDTIQHLTNVVGTDKRRDIINGSITNFLELPDTCRTSVVYVSSNQSLSIHTYNISMAEKSLGKRRTLLHRVVSVINMYPISQPLVW